MPLGRLDAELDPDDPGEPAPLEVDPMLPEPVEPDPVEPAPLEVDPMLPEPVEPDPVEPAPMLLEPVEPAAEPDAPAPLEAEPLLAESEPSEDRLSPRTRLVAWSQHCVPALGALGLVLGLFELCAVAAALAPMTSEAERRSVRPNMSIILFCFYRRLAGAKSTSG
jgi:hypothetical protein